jgi:hypothetical protein
VSAFVDVRRLADLESHAVFLGAGPPSASPFTTVRRFMSVEEARMAWSLLRSAGIEAELDHHETCSNFPLAEIAIGVELRVPTEQAEDSVAALAYVEAGAFAIPDTDLAA